MLYVNLMMTTYSIDDQHSNQITTGLSEANARQTAQRIANARGESVYLYEDVDVDMDAQCHDHGCARHRCDDQHAGPVEFTPVTADRIDRIANEHGCDIAPCNGGVAIAVQRYWQQGDPADTARIQTCREAIRAAGLHLHEITLAPTPRIEQGPAITPGLPIGARR